MVYMHLIVNVEKWNLSLKIYFDAKTKKEGTLQIETLDSLSCHLLYNKPSALPHVLNASLTSDYNNPALCVLICQNKRKNDCREHFFIYL